MSLIDKFKSTYSAIRYAAKNSETIDKVRILDENYPQTIRSFIGTLGSGVLDNTEPDFFDRRPSQIHTTDTVAEGIIGVTDVTVSPMDIYDMVNKDTYFTGLFEQLIEALFKNGWYIEVLKDKDGKLMGSMSIANEYEDKLKEIEYESKVKKQIYGDWGDGGGNVLLFTTRGPKGLEIKVEPFIDVGHTRVRVYGEGATRTVKKYVVETTERTPIYEVFPDKNFMMHLRYSEAGNYRFSTNPAKRAVYWYVLKKYLAGSALASHKNGLQDATIASPDYSALTDLMRAMSEGNDKVSSKSKKEYEKDPIKFLAKQSRLDDEIIRTRTGKAWYNNVLQKMRMPYKFQKVGRNLSEMKTIELIKLCNEEMGFAIRTSMGVINTKESKYSNAEVERDNWKELVLDAMKSKVEKVTERFYLPAYFPNYDPDIYKVRFGRNPSEEDIEIFNAKTARNKATADILNALQLIPGVKYNFDTNEIERVDEIEKPQDGKTDDVTPTADEIVLDDENKGKRLARRKKKVLVKSDIEFTRQQVGTATFASKIVNGRSTKRLQKSIANATSGQLKSYIDNLSVHNSLTEAIKNVEQDLPLIQTQGINVNTLGQLLAPFGKAGILEFTKTTKQRIMQRQVPAEAEDLLDAKSQLLIKGWGSLTKKQKDLILDFFSKDLNGYPGIDPTLAEDLQNELRVILEDLGIAGDNKIGVDQAVGQITKEIPSISKIRALLIATTESAQNLEAIRRQQYLLDGFKEHRWFTVRDSRVRPKHTENEERGWISVNKRFPSGERNPAEAVRCRCSVTYRKREL
ncbi:MAG: hypothetical protein ACFFDH_00035 [Promethearchaeota archaeon]